MYGFWQEWSRVLSKALKGFSAALSNIFTT
jgi:hypothetical protein